MSTGCSKTTPCLPPAAATLETREVVEFSLSLHVWKRVGVNGQPDLFIVGQWQGPTLVHLCLHQPLATVLTALGQVLISTRAVTPEGHTAQP